MWREMVITTSAMILPSLIGQAVLPQLPSCVMGGPKLPIEEMGLVELICSSAQQPPGADYLSQLKLFGIRAVGLRINRAIISLGRSNHLDQAVKVDRLMEEAN